MRDAFGGAFMIKLAFIFIVIYIAFIAIALNYAKAFRVKNQVINVLEQSQFTIDEIMKEQPAIDEINLFLADIKYNYSEDSTMLGICEDEAKKTSSNYVFKETSGVCIIEKGENLGKFGESSRYYQVITFIKIDLTGPFELLMNKLNFVIPISGETKVITV